MHVKYFQPLADIRKHYDDILRNFDNPKWGHLLLETWGIKLMDKEDLVEEREVLRYLVGCNRMLVQDHNAKKPTLDAAERCFNRHLVYLEEIHSCHAYNVNKHSSILIQKEYKACRHYLFQFSLNTWYEKLPNEILTFENKYSEADF
jgi:hypothetical protein